MPADLLASCKLPTEYNEKIFDILSFNCGNDDGEVVALIYKDKSSLSNETPIVRIHSACITGEVFGSQKCDCGYQFQHGMEQIASSPYGIMLYMAFHEGRGIGLTNKIKAYKLQEKGINTLEANEILGFQHDERNFEPAIDVLKFLKIGEVKLITNNPDKIAALENGGIRIQKNINITPPLNPHNQNYIFVKRKFLNHIL